MKYKILKITKDQPEVKLPNGVYLGYWTGYVVKVLYNGGTFNLDTDEGVRGFNIQCMVTIKDDDISFEQTKN